MTTRQLVSEKMALLAVIFLFFSIPGEALAQTLLVTPAQLEVEAAQSILLYHRGKYLEAVSALKKIIQATKPGSSTQVKSLEMLALCYRQMEKDPQYEALAAGTYRKLIEATKPEASAPYRFELATIRFKQKKTDEAYLLFKDAITYGFNSGTAHFFVSLIELERKRIRAALEHLNNALDFPDAEQIKPAIHYYLGNTYLQLGKTETAIQNFQAASPQTASSSAIAKQSAEGSQKILKDLDTAAFFGTASALVQWDSNVQSNPDDVASTLGPSQQQSLKSILSASLVYSTSPVRDWQFTPSYSFYGNYNFNAYTREYNFVSNTASVYIFHKPYLRFSKGFKLTSTLSFKNSPVRRGETLYTKYSLTEEIGPTFRYQMTPKLFATFEGFWKPKKFFTDPTTGDSIRSGNGALIRTGLQAITPFAWLNPQGYLAYEFDETRGTTYDLKSFQAGISNSLSLNDRMGFSQFLDYSYNSYALANPERHDSYTSLRLLLTRTFAPQLSCLLDAGYTLNSSNQSSSFSYKRIVTSLGVSYTL